MSLIESPEICIPFPFTHKQVYKPRPDSNMISAESVALLSCGVLNIQSFQSTNFSRQIYDSLEIFGWT